MPLNVLIRIILRKIVNDGIINYHDTDRVRYHAFLLWLLDNMHPVFANQQQADEFAKAREWPRVD